jgi:hypothetical protein
VELLVGNLFIGILMTLSQPRIDVSLAVDFCVPVTTFLVDLLPVVVCLDVFAVVAADPGAGAPPSTGVWITEVCVDEDVVTAVVSAFD